MTSEVAVRGSWVRAPPAPPLKGLSPFQIPRTATLTATA